MKSVQGITGPGGFRAAGGSCGIKASGAADMTLIVADGACAGAGVFTTNKVCSAPVTVCRAHLKATRGRVRAVVCNSGNANASTGKAGERDAEAMCRLVAARVGCRATEVLVCSTGVIGRLLPMEKVERGISALSRNLRRGVTADEAAAKGIMTTDLAPKSAYREVRVGGKRVRLAGICKGSGMIGPRMATMLAFVTTDAEITPPLLTRALRAAAAASFNRISVDQHTSPSDTVLAMASGAAGNRRIGPRISHRIGSVGREYQSFAAALADLCRDLAYQIVKDGEGATKVFRVVVRGAKNQKDANRIAKAVVDSPLVKTAVHGGDPNWGRITTAAGYSGAAVEAGRMTLSIGPGGKGFGGHGGENGGRGGVGVCVFKNGQPTGEGKRPSARLKRLMAGKEIRFVLDIGMGKAGTEWLGCDLSREYIAINADYTT